MWCEKTFVVGSGEGARGPGRLRCDESVLVLTVTAPDVLENLPMTNEHIKHALPQWRGDESAQRKRFLKSEEAALAENFGPDWRHVVADQIKRTA